MDYNTALEALQAMENPTIADLKSLLAEVNVTVPGAKATILYSGLVGDIGGHYVIDLVGGMALWLACVIAGRETQARPVRTWLLRPRGFGKASTATGSNGGER